MTAPVWQWENYYEPHILKCLQGKFRGDNYWEGASEGVGLGTRFLKHVERGKVLIHLIDGTAEDVVEPYKMIRDELEKYSSKLIGKPEIVALNKIDAILPDELKKKLKKLEKVVGHKVYPISGVAHQGIEDVLRSAEKYVYEGE